MRKSRETLLYPPEAPLGRYNGDDASCKRSVVNRIMIQKGVRGMVCKRCGSENVTVTTEQTSGKTRTSHMGCLWTLGRWIMVLMTCGLWLLVGKRKETGKTSFKHVTVAICQNCGHKWSL